MDSLALLCNLYGDGPATLRRLRETGLASLEAIAEAEPERLAGVLRTSVRSARRFQSEGRLLIERTAAGDPPAVAREAPAPAEDPPAVEVASRSEDPERGDPLLKKVLETWRRLDDEEIRSPSAPEETAPAPAAPGAHPAADMNLEEVAIDGLDLAQREKLAHSGILTLEDLTRCDALQLASAEGFALTRVLHWQLLGRRALASARRTATALESGAEIALTEHGILRPTPPLAGARSRAAAGAGTAAKALDFSAAPLSAIPLAARDQPLRFSPAEAPPVDAAARPQIEVWPGRPLQADGGASGADALDSAGPFA
jgi:hypothetical protein